MRHSVPAAQRVLPAAPGRVARAAPCGRSGRGVQAAAAPQPQQHPQQQQQQPPPAPPALLDALRALIDLKASGAAAPALEGAIEAARALGAAAGAASVFPSLNDGAFRGYALTGKTAARLAGDKPITMGILSFGLYQPKDLKVWTLDGDSSAAAVFKGERFGRRNAYVISTPIRLDEAGVHGTSHAIATYHFVPDMPGRLEIRFAALRLEPDPKAPGDLAKWLDALGGANPGMDRATGALEVPIPEGAVPPYWMDYHAMTQEFQLVLGSAGGVTLLQRM